MHGDRGHKSTSALFDKPQSSTMAFIGKPIPSPDGFLSRDNDFKKPVAEQRKAKWDVLESWSGPYLPVPHSSLKSGLSVQRCANGSAAVCRSRAVFRPEKPLGRAP